jgi:hypothetical protein
LKILFLGIVFFTTSIVVNAQERDYWQQKVDYIINVTLDDKTSTLDADITFVYYNNSPSELSFIYIHLWPNAYKGDGTALCDQLIKNGNTDLYYATEDKTGFIDKIDFKSNNAKLKWEIDSKYNDIAKIYLPKALKRGDSIVISTPFHVKIPSSEFSRLGHSEQSYQITQWYPKPAVYDSKGWHQMPYLNQGEFYSEYGSYNVYITLPDNYRVWATGDLIDGEKENNWLDSLSDIVKKQRSFTDDLSFPTSSTKTKTLHFYQNKVHDFAWFADKRYNVLRDYAHLENGDSVLVQAMFTNEEAKLWQKSLKYLSQSTQYYSKMVGNYPYKTVTAVQGALSAGAGMEYPNITIIGISGDDITLEETIMHEVGHNWFYGIFGFNERDYPWMDEGINTFYQSLYMQEYHPNLNLSQKYLERDVNLFGLNKMDVLDEMYWPLRFSASYNLDQASNLKAEQYTEVNYALDIYGKTSIIFHYLRDYLGEEKFDKIMHDFYKEWHYKHPQPEDFVSFFEKNCNKNLDWFFKDLLGSKKRNDYKIVKTHTVGDSLVLKLNNKGDINAPVLITAKNSIGDITEQKWIDGKYGSFETSILSRDYSKIEINNPNYTMDFNPGNNYYYPNKVFHKRKIPKLKLITDVPKAEESVLYFSPLIGWNNYNKFMFGAIFTNHSLFEKKYEYEVMPLYSFKTKNLNGSFAVRRNFYTNTSIRRLSVGLSGKKYNYSSDVYENSYNRLVPEVTFYFKNLEGYSNINHKLTLRAVVVEKEYDNYIQQDGEYVPIQSKQFYTIYNLKYLYENKRLMVPFDLKYNFEANSDIIKMDFRTDFSINYFKPKKYLDVGLFAGYMFKYDLDSKTDYSYKMSSWSGTDDYLFDYTYLGRTESKGLLAAQMTQRDGGFYIPTSLGRSWGMLFAGNLRSSIPFTNLIKLYYNIGIPVNPVNIAASNWDKLLYEGGAMLSIIDRKFEIYFPFILDKNTSNYYDLNNINYSQKIRFTLRFDLADPFKLLKDLHL